MASEQQTSARATNDGNAHERANRAERVVRIVRAIATGRNVSVSTLEATAALLASDSPWGAAVATAIAQRCGETRPMSLTTRALVAERLTELAAALRAAEGR